MTRLPILVDPDPRLRLTATPVEVFDDATGHLIDDLFETLYATRAIALSAPQVGVPREIMVMDLSGTASAPQVFVNPEILSKGAWGLVEESCLSVPGVTGNVLRATEIRVRAKDRKGETFERDLTAMDAVCVQHEMDHFAGTLFIDRLSLLRRLGLRALAGLRRRSAA